MVIVDSGGLIQLANAETEKLFGYDRDELIGRPVEILIPERFPQHAAPIEFFPARGPVSGGLDRPAQGRREFPVEISLSPLRDRGRAAGHRVDP